MTPHEYFGRGEDATMGKVANLLRIDAGTRDARPADRPWKPAAVSLALLLGGSALASELPMGLAVDDASRVVWLSDRLRVVQVVDPDGARPNSIHVQWIHWSRLGELAGMTSREIPEAHGLSCGELHIVTASTFVTKCEIPGDGDLYLRVTAEGQGVVSVVGMQPGQWL